jgi:hypothetical protein|tara:strand:- start:139 stop:684 length:546 start_codon:yes stop_codon:yes gene_type:complete
MATKNISATITKDCEAITVKIIPGLVGTAENENAILLSATRNGSPITLNNSVFPNPVVGQIITITFTAAELSAVTAASQTGVAAELSGVYVFRVTEGQTISTAGVLAACTLDCCIANEINDFMSCPCDPTKSPKLEKATKVFLLREGAEADLSAAIQNPDNALAKFNKATEICASSCGCGC